MDLFRLWLICGNIINNVVLSGNKLLWVFFLAEGLPLVTYRICCHLVITRGPWSWSWEMFTSFYFLPLIHTLCPWWRIVQFFKLPLCFIWPHKKSSKLFNEWTVYSIVSRDLSCIIKKKKKKRSHTAAFDLTILLAKPAAVLVSMR